MSDDIIYPRRPSLRLSAYDYSSPGSYFVTICAARRDCAFFCHIGQQADLFSDPPVSLTPLGVKIKQSILSIPAVNPGVAVDCYVIMPDHVHLLLNLTGQYGGHPLSKVIQLAQRERFASSQKLHTRKSLALEPMSLTLAFYDTLSSGRTQRSAPTAYQEALLKSMIHSKHGQRCDMPNYLTTQICFTFLKD